MEESDHRHRRLLRASVPHLGREQQTAASDQSNELAPFDVEHGGTASPMPISAPSGPFGLGGPPTTPPSVVYCALNLSQSGLQVLGADLNCSESRRGRPSIARAG